MSKEYRKAVDITAEEAQLVFEALPVQLLSNPKTFYPKRVVKNAPTWPRAARLVPALNVLLDATKGNAVHQKNLQTHFKKWIADQTEMNFSETDQDEIILSIRAVLCQLLNHKRNSRNVPANFARTYAVVWQKLSPHAKPDRIGLPERAQDADPDAETDDVQIVEPQASEPIIIDLEEDELLDKELLFSSSISGLQNVLQDRPKGMKRLNCKTKAAPAIDLGIPNLASLIETSTQNIEPKTFRDINAALKQRSKNGGKKSENAGRKKKKNPKNKKGKKEQTNTKAKDAKKITNAESAQTASLCLAFVKREHSKAYVAAKSKAKTEGKSDAECKAAASEAGRAKTAELRDQFAKGMISRVGVAVEDIH